MKGFPDSVEQFYARREQEVKTNQTAQPVRSLPTEYRWIGELDNQPPIIGGPYTRLRDTRMELDLLWQKVGIPVQPGTIPNWPFRRMSIFDAYGEVIYTVANSVSDA